MAKYPDSTKTSLEQRLRARARERWPQIASLHIRHRGVFSYIDATLTDATTLKLCRLRYVGSAHDWQFAIYRASHDDYDESVFFTGLPVGTCQDALDTACGLYLNDPTAWTRHPTNLRAGPLRHRDAPGDDQEFRGQRYQLAALLGFEVRARFRLDDQEMTSLRVEQDDIADHCLAPDPDRHFQRGHRPARIRQRRRVQAVGER